MDWVLAWIAPCLEHLNSNVLGSILGPAKIILPFYTPCDAVDHSWTSRESPQKRICIVYLGDQRQFKEGGKYCPKGYMDHGYWPG